MSYIAYIKNTDNSINILAGSSNHNVFSKILPKDTQYEIHEGETYQANGKTYLSESQEYLDNKSIEEKQKALSDLDSQYDQDRAELVRYYNEAVFLNDVELQEELREEMTELNNTYIQERKNIEEGENHE